jgi:putative two-component system response regulator
MLSEYLATFGYQVMSSPSAEAALPLLDTGAPDLILSDVHMDGMSGIDLCAHLKEDPRFRLTPVVLLTGVSDLEARIAGLAAGADDFFAKPVDAVELRTRVGSLLRVKVLLDRLEEAESLMTALGLTIEARDPYTAGHCERLASAAAALGRAVGTDELTIEALRLGGFLHDLGKVGVPDRVLLKPGPLDRPERVMVESHPVVGANLVQGLKTLGAVRPIIRHHHERWDGSGYPDRLESEAIPLGARIMGIVDVYDALTTARPYKSAFSHDEAVLILQEETGRGLWDPRMMTAFVETLREQELSGSATPGLREPPRDTVLPDGHG